IFKMKPPIKRYKERLTSEEITRFQNMEYENGSLIFNAQNCFMLALRMAGTRIEDMLNLRVNNIVGGRITFNMKKGCTNGALKTIKIDDKIEAILSKFITKESKPNDFI